MSFACLTLLLSLFNPLSSLDFALYNAFDQSASIVTTYGWHLMTLSDFTTYKNELIFSYNSLGGIKTLASWSSSGYCCIRLNNPTRQSLSTDGSNFIRTSAGCVPSYTGGETVSLVSSSGVTYTTLSSSVNFVERSTLCSDSNNPGVYMRNIEFTLYNYASPPAGWTAVVASTFSSSSIETRFVDSYNWNGGVNRYALWTSSNCCIRWGTSDGSRKYIQINSGASNIIPAPSLTSSSCNPSGGYSATKYWFFSSSAGYLSTLSTSYSYFTYTSCSDNNNPGLFYRQTVVPTSSPTNGPTRRPTRRPTSQPTARPTPQPTPEPTPQPTPQPTHDPTRKPTTIPTPAPSNNPTKFPSARPTVTPTPGPTAEPTTNPTHRPTKKPTQNPTQHPSVPPTPLPTTTPTTTPTRRWTGTLDGFHLRAVVQVLDVTAARVYAEYFDDCIYALYETFEEYATSYQPYQQYRIDLVDVDQASSSSRRLLTDYELTLTWLTFCQFEQTCEDLETYVGDQFRQTLTAKLANLFGSSTVVTGISITDTTVTPPPTQSPTTTTIEPEEFTQSKNKKSLFSGITLYIIIGAAAVFLCAIILCLYCYRSKRQLEKEKTDALEKQVELMQQQQQLFGGLNMEQIQKAIKFQELASKINPDDPEDPQVQQLKNQMQVDPTILNLIQMQQRQVENKGIVNTDDNLQSGPGNDNGEGGNNLLSGGTGLNSSELQPPGLPPIFNNLPDNFKDQYQVMQMDTFQQQNGGEGDNETGFSLPPIPPPQPRGRNSVFKMPPVPNVKDYYNQRRTSKFEQKTMGIMNRTSTIGLGDNNITPLGSNNEPWNNYVPRGQRLSVVNKPGFKLPPVPQIGIQPITPNIHYESDEDIMGDNITEGGY